MTIRHLVLLRFNDAADAARRAAVCADFVERLGPRLDDIAAAMCAFVSDRRINKVQIAVQ